MKLNTSKDYKKIIHEEIPLIDVRAPVEFEKGAFLSSVNLPLMNDEERHLVGICYKEKGNEEAVKLGHELISGTRKDRLIKSWKDFIDKHPNAMIYCFRGGLRSQISQQWIFETTNKEILRLEGGYKDFRNYLINALEPEEQKSKPIILGGCTGSGKTILLKKLENSIDLEGIANHRGSSFGNKINPQPTQITFENNLAYEIIKHRKKGYNYMILEDEGKNVGRCFLPKPLAEYFKSGDLVIVEVPLEERTSITMDEYVFQSQNDYMETYGTTLGIEEWSNYIQNSIIKIKKRLGGQGCLEIIDLFKQAFDYQKSTGKSDLHRSWIETLLRDYYDPMYNYQIEKTTKNIIFKGNSKEVLEYLKNK